MKYDLLIIGAGSAGFAGAIRAAELGAKVGLIEGGTVGGTCVNVGCVPSKTLIRAAEIGHRAAHHGFKGISTRFDGCSWKEIQKQKNALVSNLRKTKYVGVLKNYSSVDYIEGTAQLTGPNTISLSDGGKLESDKILITTGAHPWPAPIPGLDKVSYLNSTTAMELDELPKNMVVIGAAAVGLELAQMFARLGAEITVIEALPQIVPTEDPDIGIALARYLSEEGMSVFAGVKIESVQKNSIEYTIDITVDGHKKILKSEALLVATGRRANTSDFGLEEIGVVLSPKGFIKTDSYQQTSVPSIYAAGDCTMESMFVYVGAYCGNLAAENALKGNKRKCEISVLPKVTFTDPQVASVGLTESQAKEKGLDAISAKLSLKHIPRALAARDTRGFIKLVAEKETGKLLGAHILAPEGGELIQIPALAMKYGISVDDLATSLFPYLTQSEGIKLCAQMFHKDVSKLSCCAA